MQIDGTRKYHPEHGIPVTKKDTWYSLTDKPILAQKLTIPKKQFTDQMKLQEKETKLSMLQSFLEGGTKCS